MLENNPPTVTAGAPIPKQSVEDADPQSAIYHVQNNADLAVVIHEKDPFNPNGPDINKETLKIDRKILTAASPVFKAMLTDNRFAEAGKSEIDLIEDTGITYKAMRVLFSTMCSSFLLASKPSEVRERLRLNDELYLITPFHILELMEYTFMEFHDHHCHCPTCLKSGGSRFSKREIETQDLQWWLKRFSTQTSDGIEKMMPYASISLTKHQLASSLRQMEDLLRPGLGELSDSYSSGKSFVDIMGIAQLEKALLESTTLQTPNDSHNMTRLHLIHYTRDAIGLMREILLPLAPENDQKLAKVFQKYGQPMFPGMTSSRDAKHLCPSTYFMLTFEDIQRFLRKEISGGDFDEWDITRELWQMGRRHEGLRKAEFMSLKEIDFLTQGHATENKLVPLPIALDKYLIPKRFLSVWFDGWFKANWNPRGQEPWSDEGAEKLLTMAHAAYVFDNADAFHQTTELLHCTGNPGLEHVVLLDGRIIERLGVLKEGGLLLTLDGLCLDCFNASIYPFHHTEQSEVPGHLQQWAKNNILTFVKRMNDNSANVTSEDDSDDIVILLHRKREPVLRPANIFGCRGKKSKHNRDDTDRWARSWGGDNIRPRFKDHQRQIYTESRRLGWDHLVRYPPWLAQ
ncbi:hypothetical protein F5Y16DRAFT_400874 [Xylariaceae sp. FL0255]|nr:hypothetical protein F5Y16DRAFT_400874 [Xylariaceae sp. FL0255]